jgi:hypothetical protein
MPHPDLHHFIVLPAIDRTQNEYIRFSDVGSSGNGEHAPSAFMSVMAEKTEDTKEDG